MNFNNSRINKIVQLMRTTDIGMSSNEANDIVNETDSLKKKRKLVNSWIRLLNINDNNLDIRKVAIELALNESSTSDNTNGGGKSKKTKITKM